MFTPNAFDLKDLFRLRAAVGPLAVNNTDDVAKVETALDRLGFITMNQRQGPSGEFHSELDRGLRKFQSANRLKEDAKVNPDGPTLRKMALQIAEAPGPDKIDDTAPIGDGGGIKDLKVNPEAARDILKAIKERMKRVAKGFKYGGSGGGAGRPGGRPGQLNRKTGRIDDITF